MARIKGRATVRNHQKCNVDWSKSSQCEQEVTERCIQYHPIPSRQVIGQYHEDECTLPMCVHHDAAKHGCDHLDVVNRT
ncbi:hypothetical protein TNCV_2022151 [Trichonephila clavipes]|nr:hypothetical protein TNCV_2022151 [Trichonephila clavipes]